MAAEEEEKPPFSENDVLNVGPPPDALRRQLVFDSMFKVLDANAYQKALAKGMC